MRAGPLKRRYGVGNGVPETVLRKCNGVSHSVTMRMTSTERVALHPQWKKLGQRPVPVVVSEREIDYLLAHDYELSRKDAEFDRAGGIAVPQSPAFNPLRVW